MKIEKGKKVPPDRYGIYAKTARSMAVGDSVLMEDTPEASKLCEALRRIGCKATQKMQHDGCRVWRLK